MKPLSQEIRKIVNEVHKGNCTWHTDRCEIFIDQATTTILTAIKERVPSEENLIRILDELADKQLRSVIKAVDKKGLMNTGWEDIDKEGGHIDFSVIVKAIRDDILKNLEEI